MNIINQWTKFIFSTLLIFGILKLVPIPMSQVLAQISMEQEAQADQYFLQGIEQFRNSQFQAALQSWEEARKIYKEIGDLQGEADSLGNLGIAYGSIGQYKKAIEFLQQQLTAVREIGESRQLADVLGNLGIAHRRLGQYHKAIQYHQEALEIDQKTENRLGEAASLLSLANAYGNLSEYREAIKFYQQSRDIFQEIRDRNGEAYSLGNLGSAYENLGQYQQAIKFYKQTLKIVQETDDRQGEATTFGNLGNAYLSLAEYQKAIEFFQQQLTLMQEIHDRQGEANSFGNLGNAYLSLGQYQKAINFSRQTLNIVQEIEDRQGEAASFGNLGNIYLSLGQYQQAIEFLQRQLTIAQEIDDRDGEAIALNNLGLVYFQNEDYQNAIELHQNALTIARNIEDHQQIANSLGNLGLAYTSLEEYQKAIEYHRQYLAIVQEIGDRLGEANSHNNLGFTYFRLGELPKAEETLLEGINILESIRQNSGNDTNKVSIFDTQIKTYRTLQQVQVTQNKTNEALEIAERSRAKALVDLLTARLSDNPEDLKVNPLTIQQIQQVAKDKKATLVLYSLIEDEIFTWVIQPTGEVEFKRQNYDADLNELVEVARDSIGVRDRGVIKLVPISESDQTKQREKLQQLHQLLIEPIADFLPKNPDEPVIFMPQVALFLVPFPALQDAEGNYLVDKHTILTAPSIQTLQLTGQQRQRVSGEGVLIVGNPTMPSVPKEIGEEPVQLTPLEGAETEAKAIAEFFKTDAMIGSQATKSAVLEQIANARVVHLATHGLLDDFGLGVPGAIALAPDPNFTPEIGEFNGLLTAGEIFDLDLSAELVVLSACNTGRGQIRGEGVIGLSRSLIQAGVPSVLVSLWQVPDTPTAELMVEFYRNLEEKNLDKAQALRQAMLTIKEKHPNPRNWAAFTLIGEAE